MEYTLLKNVTQESHRWRVRVRATRFSEYVEDGPPRKVLRLDFVLLDEQGTIMEAQIPGRHLPIFNLSLKENGVYFIEYFEVANAKPSYQAVDCPIMARFTRHTKINEIIPVPENFPIYAYTVVSFDVLRARLGQSQFVSDNKCYSLQDTIGLITGISHVKTVLAKGITKTIRNINITDGRETACVTLWGPHATQFDAPGLQAEAENNPVVILFVGLTTRLYEGQLSLQGSTICKWYTNANIPEVLALRNSFSAIPHQITWFGQTQSQTAAVPMTVYELATLNAHEAVGRMYTVKIAIKELTPNEAWWYLACGGCKRTAIRTLEGYRCARCNDLTAEPRYKIPVRGTDIDSIGKTNAPTVEFVFFGDIGQELVGMSALDLAASAPTITGFVPPEITRLYGRQYSLKVSGSRGSLQRLSASFQVDSFSIISTNLPLPLPAPVQTETPKDAEPVYQTTASSSKDTGKYLLLPSSISTHTEHTASPVATANAPVPQTTPEQPGLHTPPSPEISKSTKRPAQDSPMISSHPDDDTSFERAKKSCVRKIDMDTPANE